MKNILRKSLYILLMVTMIITSFTPYNTKAYDSQIIKPGGTNTDGRENGATVSKIISPAKDENGNELENYFDIELTVKAHDIVREITIKNDVAIMLVLDRSGSMDYCMNSSKTCKVNKNQRMKNAIDAIKSFVNETYSKQTQFSDSIFKLGLVSYSNYANLDIPLSKITSSDQFDDTLEGLKAEGGTNLEAALKTARLELEKETKIENKYLIVLTDGYPTAFIKTNSDNDKCYSYKSEKNDADYTYKIDNVKYCTRSGNYYNKAAQKAQDEAVKIHNDKIETYMVAVGLDYQPDTTTDDVDDLINGQKPVVGGNGYYSGWNLKYNIKPTHVKNWIKNNIVYSKDSGKKTYYGTEDSDLKTIYDTIFKDISAQIDLLNSLWSTTDPINSLGLPSDYVEYDGIYNSNDELVKTDQLNNNSNERNQVTFTADNSTIKWDLRRSDPINPEGIATEFKNSKGETIREYTYTLKYRVRLKNEVNDFVENQEYNTNGKAILNYVLKASDDELTDPLSLEYPIPSVKGYLGEFTFNKISDYYNNGLKDAEFELVFDSNSNLNKTYLNEYSHVDFNTKYIAKSDEKGNVTFKNIPSGYEYILRESKAPEGYIKDDKEYKVSVINNVVTVEVPETGISNCIKYQNLVVKKFVNSKAYIDPNKEFEFEIVLENDNPNVKGYNYTKDETSGVISIENHKGTFKLKHNETIKISLPYGIKYTIKETNTNNYNVSYDKYQSYQIKEDLTTVVTNTKKPTDIKVNKQWENIHDYVELPKVEITLQKSIDGKNWENVNKIELNSSNQFYYEWKNLDGDYAYKVVETNVIGEDPNVFEVNYKFDESTGTWTVTNTDTRIMILPETGSSGALILASLALVLMAMPVMYTAYNLYIEKRWF